jgi:Ran GTPase-activating protein (RanGAP) involved in mRNA processing and transport
MEHLAMSGNEIGHGKETTAHLNSFISKTKLKTLSVADTALDLPSLLKALGVKSVKTIESLDISGNKIDAPISASVAKFASVAQCLTWLGLGSCKMTAATLEGILTSVSMNKSLAELLVMVDVRDNELGTKKGDTEAMCRAISGAKYLNGLGLVNNKFKKRDLVTIIQAIPSGNLRRLELGSLKKSDAKIVIPAITEYCLTQRGGCLESLVLSGDDKKTYTPEILGPLLDSIGDNRSLLHLDISNNLLGDLVCVRVCLRRGCRWRMRVVVRGGSKLYCQHNTLELLHWW